MRALRWATRTAIAMGMLTVGAAHGPAAGQEPPAVLGLAADVVADGRPPWEDRPLDVPGVGRIPGTAGLVDPGDDLGPSDGVVRTYDAVTLRFSYSARVASPENLVLTVELPPSMVWEPETAGRLRLSGCPGGAAVELDRSRLTCRLGNVVVPPAITGMIEAVALVRGSASHGTTATVAATLRAANGRGDSDDTRCPEVASDGCRAVVGPLRVSAAPGLELSKILEGSTTPYLAEHEGATGWLLPWRVGVFASGDGDARGNAAPVPMAFDDWWTATVPGGAGADVGGRLVSCRPIFGERWTCEQPGGDGTPVLLGMASVDPDRLETSNSALLLRGRTPRATLLLLGLVVFVSEAAVERAGGEVLLRNCAATLPGAPAVSTFRPVDAAGNPNLGGLGEPVADNCAEVRLIAGRGAPEPSPTAGKAYDLASPGGLGQVIADEAFESVVTLRHDPDARDAIASVMLCDAFDNMTQRLDAGATPIRGVVLNTAGQAVPPAAGDPIVELAAGPWGASAASGDRGRAWHAQSTRACDDDAPVNPAGWVSLDEIDPADSGAARLDARDVNLIRVRFADPVAPGHAARMSVRLKVLPNPDGTLLINYGGTRHEAAGSTVQSRGQCYGGRAGTCPDPPSLQGSDFDPGYLGDALVLVAAPTRIVKRVARGATSATAYAGAAVTFTLSAEVGRTSPPLPPGIVARSVAITDVLPRGLAFVPGSAIRASEDANGNGVLDPGEDVDGDGQLDPEAPLAPAIEPERPGAGETRLTWSVGALRAGNRPMTIRYAAEIDPLAAGGTVLRNAATVRALGELDAGCSESWPTHRYRCGEAVVQVVNRSLAAVDKRAVTAEVRPGEPVTFQLRVANLMPRHVEWFDAVDVLPWPRDGRTPPSDFEGSWRGITVTVAPGAADVAVWASAADPEALDVAGGSLPDALLDPVAAYGGPGAGLGGPDWPCPLAAVGTPACPAIDGVAAVTALRFWAPDPDPTRGGTAATSFLPIGAPPRAIAVVLEAAGTRPGDVLSNAWGGRFEGLELPAFHGAAARVRVAPAYLPAAQTAGPTIGPPCAPRPADVILVLDASTSMRRASEAGGTKIEAVVRSAGTLVEMLAADGAGHRVAIAGFNDRAWIVQPLTEDRRTALAALDALAGSLAEGTRLDLGLLVGSTAADPASRARRVMVLLSDGLPNRVPTPIPAGRQEDTVLRAAAAVQRMKIAIHAIGYGRPDAPDLVDRVNPELLAAIAGSEGTSVVAADSASLHAAFEAIGADLSCPKAGP